MTFNRPALAPVSNLPVVSAAFKDEVRDLYENYADTIDNLDLESWPSYFTDDCRYLVISHENQDAGLTHATIYCDGIGMVRDRAMATRDCTVYEPRYLRHFMHGLRITSFEGDVIRAKATFMVIESVSDKEPYVHMVGQYQDIIVRGSDGLKFKERLCVYDNFRIYTSLIFPI